MFFSASSELSFISLKLSFLPKIYVIMYSAVHSTNSDYKSLQISYLISVQHCPILGRIFFIKWLKYREILALPAFPDNIHLIRTFLSTTALENSL